MPRFWESQKVLLLPRDFFLSGILKDKHMWDQTEFRGTPGASPSSRTVNFEDLRLYYTVELP